MSTALSLVVIGVPTFRRPHGLRRLLDSLANQKAPFPIHVLVADNEGLGGSGIEVVKERQAAGFPYPLTVIAVPERGISQARNALMEEGFGNLGADALAMVDDDEWVESDWIAALVKAQLQTGADVVGGRVLPEFAGPVPRWAQNLDVYWFGSPPADAIPTQIGYTCGILLARAVYTRFSGERFDPSFSLTGGGDREFFQRLSRRRATFAFAPDATAHEAIGESRATRGWAIQRSFRNGCGYTRVLLLHSTSLREKVIQVPKIAAAIIYSTGMILFYFWSPALQMRGILLLVRQFGKIAGALDFRLGVYKVTHGS